MTIESSPRTILLTTTLLAVLAVVLPELSQAFSSAPLPIGRLHQNDFRLSTVETQLAAVKSTASKRSKTLSSLVNWAETVDIKLGGVEIKESTLGGLGLIAKQELPGGSLVLTVPSKIALSIETPGDGPDDRSVVKLTGVDRKTLETLPWYAQFAVYLYKLDQVNSKKNDKIEMKPWLDSLPRDFDTPIHWSASQRDELQYGFLTGSVDRQQNQWKEYYQRITTGNSGLSNNDMKWGDFLWGCECARSRAFSGAYTGSAFNPFSYAFTLLLVLVYVGLDLGTLEQAANGAGLVFCAQVFKDFIAPKLFKKKRYVICPIMDMANHKSIGTTSEVSFEFFGDAYSVAVYQGASVLNGKELYISYGTRSNDQLLQYYGFVEPNNPNDVYIMPPLREWNIGALEKACGRTFAPGRLQKLDRAGLLGSTEISAKDSIDMEEAADSAGRVVVTRAGGVDPAVIQALRALVSTDAEWKAAGEAIGNFVEENSAGQENERLARLAAKTQMELELQAKPTTLDEDLELLNRWDQMKSLDTGIEGKLALLFRIEKKKLLKETIRKLT